MKTFLCLQEVSELTSRMFLEFDSLKDGLHLKLIWRRAEEGGESCKYVDENWASNFYRASTVRGYVKEKAGKFRADSCYSMDIPVEP